MERVGANTDATAADPPEDHAEATREARPGQPIIVGLDGLRHDADALALGQQLRRALGARLLLAHVIAPAPLGRGMAEYERLERKDGQDMLALTAAELGGDVEVQLLDPGRPATALSRLVASCGGMLVLGSGHRGPIGRVVPGGVASHLLTRAHCPIAVAPVGYGKLAKAGVSRVGVAYDGTSEARVALEQAADAAGRLSVPLRLYIAIHEISDDPAWDAFRAHITDFAQHILGAGLQRLPAEIDASGVVLEGPVPKVIAHQAFDDRVDLLYVGSRGYGPLREALLGGVAGGLLLTARCPLVIIPRAFTRRSSDGESAAE